MKQGCNTLLCRFGFAVVVMSLLSSLGCEMLQSAGGYPETASWRISVDTVFPEGKPANPFIQQLIDSLKSRTLSGAEVSEEEFRELLQRASTVVYQEKVIKYATPQSVEIQNKEHEDFSRIFLKSKRIKQGAEFLQTHDSTLTAAQVKHQVKKQDIVSILMWESGLGEFVGDHLIFNIFLGQLLYLDEARTVAVKQLIADGALDSAAVTITAAEKARLQRLKKGALRNLITLIRMGKEKGYDAAQVKGSWGGAIGYVQFMPNSMQFAVDGDANGQIDLCTWPDAIFSVANYLQKNGYGASDRARRRAIHAYNPLDSYVTGVMKYANAIWERYESSHKEN